MVAAPFTFTATAKDARSDKQRRIGNRFELLGAWTDGVMLSTEHEPPDFPAAFRLKKGATYRITVEEV